MRVKIIVQLLGFSLAVLPLLATASVAEAKKARPAKKAESASKNRKGVKAKKAKAKNLDFLADEIDGARVGPGGVTVFGNTGAKHKSLIRLRQQFISEIHKSTENL